LLHFDTRASCLACDVYRDLRLESDKLLSVTNMHALDTANGVKKYRTPADIAEEHYHERLRAYENRLEHQRRQARVDLSYAEAREGFIRAVVEKTLVIGMASESVIADFATRNGWPRLAGAYDYLSNMPIASMTLEKHERLVRDVEAKRRALEELMLATEQEVWLREIDRVVASV
jgi:hypothetical protein